MSIPITDNFPSDVQPWLILFRFKTGFKPIRKIFRHWTIIMTFYEQYLSIPELQLSTSLTWTTTTPPEFKNWLHINRNNIMLALFSNEAHALYTFSKIDYWLYYSLSGDWTRRLCASPRDTRWLRDRFHCGLACSRGCAEEPKLIGPLCSVLSLDGVGTCA